MRLISTWTYLWLLLQLSLIVDASSNNMTCYHCRNDKECAEESRPFNSIPCTDPVAVCLIVLVKKKNVGNMEIYRGCAHPDWVKELGGVADSCVAQDNGGAVEFGGVWPNGHPEKMVGGTGTFDAGGAHKYEICSCSAAAGDKCNDEMGQVGEPYPPPPPQTNGNSQCVCDKNENKCQDKDDDGDKGSGGKSGSEVGHHLPSTVALGGVIVITLSVWRAVHDSNHMNGF